MASGFNALWVSLRCDTVRIYCSCIVQKQECTSSPDVCENQPLCLFGQRVVSVSSYTYRLIVYCLVYHIITVTCLTIWLI